MTQERLIELIEELFEGWTSYGYARPDHVTKAEIGKMEAEVTALLAALKERKIVLQEYEQYSDE